MVGMDGMEYVAEINQLVMGPKPWSQKKSLLEDMYGINSAVFAP
jgi:hypothetical protein